MNFTPLLANSHLYLDEHILYSQINTLNNFCIMSCTGSYLKKVMVEYTAKLFGEIHGSRTYSSIFCLFARPSGRLYLPLIEEAREDQLLRLFFGGCALVRASFLGWSTGMRAAFS